LLVTAEPAQALFVVGSTTLNAGDAALKSRLESMGLTVTVKDAPNAVTADALGKVLVLISGTVVSGDVNVKFRDVAVPVIVLEPLLFDDMKMTGTAIGTDYDVINSQTQVSIFTPSHPLAAGLTGTVTVNTSPIIFSWGNPSTGAVKAATLVGNPVRATSFGYPGGATMVGMNAPARRVGLFILNDNATTLTADGWKLFDAAVSWCSSWGVRWLVSDQLGTPRMVFDKTGNLSTTKRHDYLPFGEELFAGIGSRTTALGYTADSTRQQFTSKERDNETGLDYFLARYYSSSAARFTTPDSFGGSKENPQTLNRYAYVQNNPLNYNDPTGNFAGPVYPPLPQALCGNRMRLGCSDEPMLALQGQERPTKTAPPVNVPEGYEIREDGSLVKKDGSAVIQEKVTIKPKKGFFRRVFGRFGRIFGGAAGHIVAEMIDPDVVGGGDADLGVKDYGFALDRRDTFLDGRFSPHRLTQDTIFYRVFSDPERMKGMYLTDQYFTSSSDAIKMLALSPSVTPNKATHIVAVVVPSGTIIARGQAAPQHPRDKYPGGGSQVLIPNALDPRIQWVNPHTIGK
jgi:RHS repeat-associated protein